MEFFAVLVNNYSKESPLSTSGAKVVFYNGSKKVNEVSVPTEGHSPDFFWWDVARIDASQGQLIIINKVQGSNQ